MKIFLTIAIIILSVVGFASQDIRVQNFQTSQNTQYISLESANLFDQPQSSKKTKDRVFGYADYSWVNDPWIDLDNDGQNRISSPNHPGSGSLIKTAQVLNLGVSWLAFDNIQFGLELPIEKLTTENQGSTPINAALNGDSTTGLGDSRLVAKWNFLSTHVWNITAIPFLNLPTGFRATNDYRAKSLSCATCDSTNIGASWGAIGYGLKFAFEADYDVKTTLNIGVEFHPGSKITGLNSNGDIYNKVDFQIQIPVALGFFLPIKNNFGLNLESTFNDVQKKHNEYTHAGEVLMGVRYWPSKDVSVHLAMGTGSLENRGGNDPRWVAGLKMPFWLPNAVAESEKKEVINQPVAPMSTEQALTTVSQKILNLKSVEFDLGQSTLTTQGQKILDETYELLKPYENEISTLSITGHTDHYGRVDKNRKLSFDRAQTVRKYLIDKKLNIQEITAVGVGSSKPKYDPSKATKAEIDLNRRVEFDIHKK